MCDQTFVKKKTFALTNKNLLLINAFELLGVKQIWIIIKDIKPAYNKNIK